MVIKKLFLIFSVCLFLVLAQSVSAHLPRIIYNQSNDIQIKDPQNSQDFYDELGGNPRNYLINSDIDFNLYINLQMN